MQYSYLSSTVDIKTISQDSKKGIFEVEGLFAGYGLTIGNALRRALLSSLPGAAVTEFNVKNVQHEFSTIPGIKEDLVEISLNLKKLRFKMHADEPQVLVLKAKGEKVVLAKDIEANSMVEVANLNEEIATLTSKDAELYMEIKVEKGLGYLPVDQKKGGRLAIGTVAVDAIFTPVQMVNYNIENMRVGERTDYDRLRIEIETDGTISPSAALHKAANILKDHFEKVSAVEVKEIESPKSEISAEAPKKRGRPKKTE